MKVDDIQVGAANSLSGHGGLGRNGFLLFWVFLVFWHTYEQWLPYWMLYINPFIGSK